jgi:hypothetical protein
VGILAQAFPRGNERKTFFEIFFQRALRKGKVFSETRILVATLVQLYLLWRVAPHLEPVIASENVRSLSSGKRSAVEGTNKTVTSSSVAAIKHQPLAHLA